VKLSAVVLTRNEEANITDCLRTIAWADERLVVDSGSADATCDLARNLGAKVIYHPFRDFADQRNFAMREAEGDWVLFVDADERVTPELASEIQAHLKADSAPRAYAIPRQTYFFGKRLRFSESREDAPFRLFPRGQVRWIQPVHEKIETTLPSQKLTQPMLHFSTRNLTHYIAKFPTYLACELATMHEKNVRPSLFDCALRPPARFIHLYFWKLGILDGIAGFQYAILSAYYTFKKHWMYFKTTRNAKG